MTQNKMSARILTMKEMICATPTWSNILPVLVRMIEQGDSVTRANSIKELERMAALADNHIKHLNSESEPSTPQQPDGGGSSGLHSTDSVSTTDATKNSMTMSMWLATEGGRKCPQCGRYAKESELGRLGGWFGDDRVRIRATLYGHKPGYGCNK